MRSGQNMAEREYEVTLTVSVVVVEDNVEEAEREFGEVRLWEVLYLGEAIEYASVWSVEVGDWVER